MNPLVSVIIPCYNGEKYISEAIQSVRNQTYTNIEIIVVDDNSQDNTKKIIEMNHEDVRLIEHKENRGIAATRNTGITQAQGKYVSLLDQDDIYMETRIEKMVRILERNPTLGMAISNYFKIDEKGEKIGRRDVQYDLMNWTTNDIAKFLIFDHWRYQQPHLPLTSDFIRTDVFDKIGYYNEDLFGFNDQDFLLRLSEEYDVKLVKKPLLFKRDHKNNAIKNRRKIINDKFEFYNNIIDEYPSMQVFSNKIQSHLYLKESRKNFQEKKLVATIKNFILSFYYSRAIPLISIYRYVR